MATIHCKACGKSYNYEKNGCCPECGAYNRPPRRERVDADGTVHHLTGQERRSVPRGGKVCFEKKECHGKGGRTYPCDEDATTGALLFFEPRVRMEITPGTSGLVLGGYVGMGVLGGTAPTMGLFVGFATPHEKLRP